MKRLFLFAIILISGCAPSVSPLTDAQQGLNAAQVRVTNAALVDQDMRNATAQAQQRSTDAAVRATDTARSATEQAAQATQAAIRATEQAQRIEADATKAANNATMSALSVAQQSNAATAQAAQNQSAVAISINAATATARAVDQKARLDADNATKQAAEIHATITAANLAAQTEVNNRKLKEDFWYILPDVLMRYVPCGAIIIGMLLVLYVGRAIAARIAGDSDRADLALQSFSLPIYLLAPPTPQKDDISVSDNTETRITGYTGNTAENAGNTVEMPDVITVNTRSGTHYLPRLTTEQHIELSRAKALCLDWLYRAKQWDVENGRPNNYIARHHHLKMKPEDAGDAREMLERLAVIYVKQGGKPEEQGTYIMPDYGTIDNVIALIRSGDIRVSPPGFNDSLLKQSATLDAAIDAIPLAAEK